MATLLVDPATIDPRQILAGIAADSSAPASARVAACRALLGQRDSQNPADGSDVAARAVKLMADARERH